ncbi:MAG: hypothetical protein IOC63_19860 [Methylobacterium sp.]|nr:hypothetical protein [Methylobacterium sp.]
MRTIGSELPFCRPIGCATLTSSADHPLLHRRSCANLSQGLWHQPDDQPGSQQIDALGLILDSDPRRVTKTGVMQAEPSEN